MRLLALAAVALSAAVAVAGDAVALPSRVVDLTHETFTDFLKENPTVLVELYQPSCSVCKLVAPEYERAAQLLAAAGVPAVLARVNAHAEPELAEVLEVRRVPAFHVFRNGAREPFPVLTTAEAISAGLARMLGVPNADSLSVAREFGPETSADEFFEWLFWRGVDGGKLVTSLVLYAPPVEGCAGAGAEAAATAEGSCTAEAGASSPSSDAASLAASYEKLFSAVTSRLLSNPNLRSVAVRAPAIIRDVLGAAAGEATTPEEDEEAALLQDGAAASPRKPGPALLLYKDHDEGRTEYTGPLDADALEAWVTAQLTPMVALVTHKNLQRYRRNVDKLAFLFLSEAQTEHPATLARLQAALLPIAQAAVAAGSVTRGKFTLAIAAGDKYKSWKEHLGLPAEGHLPALGGEDIRTGATYALSGADGLDFARAAACTGAPASAAKGEDNWTIEADAALCGSAAAASVGADGEVSLGQGEEATGYRPLTAAWVDLPADSAGSWLGAFLAGALPPTKVGDPTAALLGGAAPAASA